MNGLLQGWISCLNSQEWCFGLEVLYLCPLSRFVLPPLLCSCSAAAVKGFREGVFSGKVVFSPWTASVQFNSHKHTHAAYTRVRTLLSVQKTRRVGRGSLNSSCSIVQLTVFMCVHLLQMQQTQLRLL